MLWCLSRWRGLWGRLWGEMLTWEVTCFFVYGVFRSCYFMIDHSMSSYITNEHVCKTETDNWRGFRRVDFGSDHTLAWVDRNLCFGSCEEFQAWDMSNTRRPRHTTTHTTTHHDMHDQVVYVPTASRIIQLPHGGDINIFPWHGMPEPKPEPEPLGMRAPACGLNSVHFGVNVTYL
jgi:hypothetical protein